MDALAQLNTSLAGRYALEREIGAGGMATVYLARDLKHNRRVALKVLNPELGAVLGVERFLSEIQVTANLQHPNLLPLFDSGEAEGLLFYVMPYVEGESLRARIQREKQLPIDEAIHIATAVASALDYAHRHGVIHRDLKPENILLHDREPLVADFGIALAVSKAGGNRITQTGLSLGTPQYMSPEQATGDRAIDGRTDVYSLGAVLYEMLTGEPPHDGTTAQAIIAKVITDKPRSIRLARDTVPAHVEGAVECALAKLPADRFATARDLADTLSGVRGVAVPSGVVTPGSVTRDVQFTISLPMMRARSLAPWLVAGLAIGTAAWALMRPSDQATRVTRFQLTLPDSFRVFPGAGPVVALSPDGSRAAIVGAYRGLGRRVFLREFNDLALKEVRGTDNAMRPVFSPDGRWIAFQETQSLKKVPIDGGTSIVIADTVGAFSWGDDDFIVFTPPGPESFGLKRVSAAGGPIEILASPDSAKGETAFLWPHVLPGSTGVLFALSRGDVATTELAVLDVRKRAVIGLGVAGINPRYATTGHIVFGRVDGTTLFSAPFDLRRLRVTGPVVPVLEDVLVKSGGATEVALATDGTLLMLHGFSGRRLAILDQTGRLLTQAETDNKTITRTPRFSPDGKRIALAISSGGSSDIWIYELAARTLTRLTTDAQSSAPAWSSDGRRVGYVSGRGGEFFVVLRNWDGSGKLDTVLRRQGLRQVAFSPRGRHFAFSAGRGPTGDIYLASLDSAGGVQPLLQSPAMETAPAISPDGRWLAYTSNESGTPNVYVRPLAGVGGRFQLSTSAAGEPAWSPDGRRIYYRSGGQFMAATLSLGSEPTVLRREIRFEDNFAIEGTRHGYDVSPDGRTFAVGRLVGDDSKLVITLNWFNELRDRMALATKK